MAKPKGGLTKWFKEDWRDVKTGKKCGRSGKEKSKRPYPSCRPKKVLDKMTAADKGSSSRRKTGPKAIKHSVTASGRRRKTK
jgi:hypothetical protein